MSARMRDAASLAMPRWEDQIETCVRDTHIHWCWSSTGDDPPKSSYDPASDPRNQRPWPSGLQRIQSVGRGNACEEASRMEELEAAWATREQERRAAVAQAQKQYSALEAKLRHKFDMVEQRERALHLKELR